jgi:cytochrome c-type biogenesis protein
MDSLTLPLAVFVAGLVSFLSPCVLPLVPGYVSFVSGSRIDELRRHNRTHMRPLLLRSSVFILGFSIVFIALGAIASSAGRLLGQQLSVLTKIAGLIIIASGVHKMGWLPIKWLYVDRRLRPIGQSGTAAGSFLVGFSFGFGWTPCVGPVLTTVLTVAASEATVGKGAALLAVYSAGLAVPFLLTSIAIDRFLLFSSGWRRHLHTLEVMSGATLVTIGVMIFTGQFTRLNAWMNSIPLVRRIAEKFL